jgi:3-isopropylmalate dehydrogenase
MNGKVALIPGAGVGQEILDEARAVLDQVAQDFGHAFTFEEARPESGATEVLAACRRADAALCGAGGGNSGATAQLALHTTLRPFRIFPPLVRALPRRVERFRGVDLLVVSESPDVPARPAAALERAFELASRRWHLVTSVDAAQGTDVFAAWRDAALEVARRHPGIRLEHVAVDHAALRFITSPTQFDVVAAPAPLADLLIEQSATLGGSRWLLAGGAVGDGTFGLYSPLQGPGLELARGTANPVGGILAAALLLRHSLGLEREASAVEAAVAAAIAHGARSADLSGDHPLTTRAMGEAIRANLATDFSTSRAI